MDYQAKILSQNPARESHLVELLVEILKADGTRFNPSKMLTVEVTFNADAEDIKGAVRRAMSEKTTMTIQEMVGETFSLRRER